MPPRRSARVAAVVERESSALPPLPLAIVLAIFALLPVDQRLLCRAVCRGWRTVLGDVSLWLRLDLTTDEEDDGVVREVTDALLRAAAARACGWLEALDVSRCLQVTQEALLAVVRENAGLRELRVCHNADEFMKVAAVEALLRAAPQLVSFEVDADGGTPEESQRMLRNEGVFAPLRLHMLYCKSPLMEDLTEGELVTLASDMTSHTWLKDLGVFFARLDTTAALDAFVNAALVRQLTNLTIASGCLSPASAPALARLLGSASLKNLYICGGREQRLFDAAAAVTLGAALRTNRTLAALSLADVEFWHDPGTTIELFARFPRTTSSNCWD
jgi:hypothetical protein